MAVSTGSQQNQNSATLVEPFHRTEQFESLSWASQQRPLTPALSPAGGEREACGTFSETCHGMVWPGSGVPSPRERGGGQGEGLTEAVAAIPARQCGY